MNMKRFQSIQSGAIFDVCLSLKHYSHVPTSINLQITASYFLQFIKNCNLKQMEIKFIA